MSAQRSTTQTQNSGGRSADASLIILVVDDESDLREMLTRSFSREGHRVMAVGDGRAAIDRASTDHFDIILLDVALGPGPDGYEVCRTLRARRNVVPIIMLTALDSEADAVLGLEAGADDYVTKPFGLAELRSRIRAVLRRAGTPAWVACAQTRSLAASATWPGSTRSWPRAASCADTRSPSGSTRSARWRRWSRPRRF